MRETSEAKAAQTRKPERNTAHRAAAWAALAAACLASSKLALFGLTGSLIVALSAWDSVLDVLVSFINQRIIKFARTGADAEHPYGHGKAESIASLGQGALIIGGSVVILGSSIQKMGAAWRGQTEVLHNSWGAVAFFVVAGFVSLLISASLARAGKRHRSPALLADSEHYRVDVVTNIASAASIAAVLFTRQDWLDPLLACAFSLYIARSGLSLMKTSVDELMDHDVDESVKSAALKLIVEADPRIVDVHKFRGRKSGHRHFFDFHVTLPAQIGFLESHLIVERIEDLLKDAFDADVVVHADPDGDDHNPEGDVLVAHPQLRTSAPPGVTGLSPDMPSVVPSVMPQKSFSPNAAAPS